MSWHQERTQTLKQRAGPRVLPKPAAGLSAAEGSSGGQVPASSAVFGDPLCVAAATALAAGTEEASVLRSLRTLSVGAGVPGSEVHEAVGRLPSEPRFCSC